MLKRLSVENYVLIDRLELELAGGLNIITGETGAGKSILLGALSLLLGARAEGGVMRDESKNCVIEGDFEIEGYGLESFFADNDIDYDPHTVVRRVISGGGKSRAYINDLPVQLTTLKELGSRLIDIHSQHQTLMLSSDAFRCGILDSVAGNAALLAEYRTAYIAWQKSAAELDAARRDVEANAKQEEYLRFQYDQLNDAKLADGEQEVLEAEQSELSHSSQIQEALGAADRLLSEDETGILPRLKAASQAIGHTTEYYSGAAELYERINSALLELRDIEDEVASRASRVDADPRRLEIVDNRLALLYTLQKRHGADSLAALIALRDDYAAKLSQITFAGEHIEKLEKQSAALRKSAEKVAGELSKRRRKAATEVKTHVEKLLENLGMPGAQFVVEVSGDGELHSTGADVTRFLFTANRNGAPQPVEKVASGGELSRLMLSLKSLVAERSMLPTIIFDEIDAGVSGRIADAMGEIICSVAHTMQVINITHLPQVASKGETHFVVYKEHTAEGSRSLIRRLEAAERVEEIAKMLSGSTISDAALEQARILLGS